LNPDNLDPFNVMESKLASLFAVQVDAKVAYTFPEGQISVRNGEAGKSTELYRLHKGSFAHP
jgi:hypothetical protein